MLLFTIIIDIEKRSLVSLQFPLAPMTVFAISEHPLLAPIDACSVAIRACIAKSCPSAAWAMMVAA